MLCKSLASHNVSVNRKRVSKMQRRDLVLLSFSVLLLVSSAAVVAVLSFMGAYMHQSLDYFFHEERFGTFYPVALLALSSLSCFSLHVRDAPSFLSVFRNPVERQNFGFGVDLHSLISHWMSCSRSTKRLILNCIIG